jgi:hypothetical protein
MPTPLPEIQAKVAAFHKKYPAPDPVPDGFIPSPVRMVIPLSDPVADCEGFIEHYARGNAPGKGMTFSHAELGHDDARSEWHFILWFLQPMTEDQKELQSILKHGEQMDFDSYAKFLAYLREVMPLPAYNRARPLLEKAGITELLWQQERKAKGQSIGVSPSKMFREAMAKGGKPIMFGDKAEQVRAALDERRKAK